MENSTVYRPLLPLVRLFVKPMEFLSFKTVLKEYSVEEVSNLAKLIYDEVSDYEFDIVIGVERKGVPLARYLAKRLDNDFDTIRINHYSKSNLYPVPFLNGLCKRSRLIKEPKSRYEGNKILLVDDWCATGMTLSLASRCLKGDVKTAVLFDSSEERYKVDFSLDSKLFPKIPVFPWAEVAPAYINPIEFDIPIS